MEKYLNEKNIMFVAHIATGPEGFNLLTSIELCIDEWYLGNPIKEDIRYNSVAKDEFSKLLFGNMYKLNGVSRHSEILTNSLLEFFKEYIAPKHIQIQKITYDYLYSIKNNPEKVYVPGTENDYKEFKIEHFEEIIDLVRDIITDWNFGFEFGVEDK